MIRNTMASYAPINPDEYLSDADLSAMRTAIAEYLPAGWFASEPEAVTDDSSIGTTLARFARLRQTNGPKLGEQLCIWRDKHGFILTDQKGGGMIKWPAVTTVEAAVQIIAARISVRLTSWGLKRA